jgi:hypothetical protein
MSEDKKRDQESKGRQDGRDPDQDDNDVAFNIVLDKNIYRKRPADQRRN